VLNLATGVVTQSVGNAGAGGNANVGATGGGGGNGNVFQVNL
jgi:hypothetical protein